MLRLTNNELSDKLRELWTKCNEFLPTLNEYEQEIIDLKTPLTADIHIPDFDTVAETEKVFSKNEHIINIHFFLFSSLFIFFLYLSYCRFITLKICTHNSKLELRQEMNTLQSNVDYLTNKIEIPGYDKMSNETNLNYEQDNIPKKGIFIQ